MNVVLCRSCQSNIYAYKCWKTTSTTIQARFEVSTLFHAARVNHHSPLFPVQKHRQLPHPALQSRSDSQFYGWHPSSHWRHVLRFRVTLEYGFRIREQRLFFRLPEAETKEWGIGPHLRLVGSSVATGTTVEFFRLQTSEQDVFSHKLDGSAVIRTFNICGDTPTKNLWGVRPWSFNRTVLIVVSFIFAAKIVVAIITNFINNTHTKTDKRWWKQ